MKRPSFGDILTRAMVRKGVDSKTLQIETGVPWTTLSTWLGKENSKPMVTKSFKKVVRYLELTLEEILEIA